MVDHHPDAINHRGKPTIFHPAPSPYGIPYRCLYSKDMDNLFCAGRNISATHMAMSSTRVMGTTSVMGQAVGTAAAIAIEKGLSTRGGYEQALGELQNALRDDDQYIPWTKRDGVACSVGGELSLSGRDAEHLNNGHERGLGDSDNGAWIKDGNDLAWAFPDTVKIAAVRVVGDSQFEDTKRMPCRFPKDGNRTEMPAHLVKSMAIEVMDEEGNWQLLASLEENFKRLIKVPVNGAYRAVRLSNLRSWGSESCHLFSFDVELSQK